MSRKKSILASATASLWLLLSAAILTVLFYSYKYLPFMLCAVQLALPGAINLILILIGRDIPISDKHENIPPDGRLFLRVWRTVKHRLIRLLCLIGRLFNRIRTVISTVLIIICIAVSQLFFWIFFGRATSLYTLSFLPPVILAALFVSFLALEKWCAHLQPDNDRYDVAVLGNLRSALAAGRLTLSLCAIAAVIKILGIYDAQRWLIIGIAVIFCYQSLFFLISLTVVCIRHEFASSPDLSIPLPFAGGSSRDLGLLSYLEKNTGITMRSLWSLKLIKKLIPYTVLLAVILFWCCTGIVQIESNQEGAVYRFGKLQGYTLEPGIHMLLPYPFDRVEIYDTGTVNRMTVGYISSEDSDNIWTAGHGSSEYKLLLGGGNELVSINLRIEYKITDLYEYLRSSSSPESILRALAYESVTARTINTDLDSLLSVDRSAFSQSFAQSLSEDLFEYHIGLSVVNVVLESIHPPVEIASVYQEIVSAGILAEQYMLDAEAKAAVTKAEAEKSRDTAINSAKAAQSKAVAAARAEVSGFLASVSADTAYPDAYRYNKYLTAAGKAYGGSKLVIVGDGIDSSKIYFGNITVSE